MVITRKTTPTHRERLRLSTATEITPDAWRLERAQPLCCVGARQKCAHENRRAFWVDEISHPLACASCLLIIPTSSPRLCLKDLRILLLPGYCLDTFRIRSSWDRAAMLVHLIQKVWDICCKRLSKLHLSGEMPGIMRFAE